MLALSHAQSVPRTSVPIAAQAVATPVPTTSPPPLAPRKITYVADDFTRKVAGGWSTATTGGAYSLAGSPTDYAINGAAATMLIRSEGGENHAATLETVSALDVDFSFRVQSDKLPPTGNLLAYFAARGFSGANEYRPRLRFAPSGGVFLQAVRADSGNETALGTEVQVPGLIYLPDTYLWVHGQVQGTSPTTIRLRAWADGQTEPATWQYTATDSDASLQEAGNVGLRGHNPTKSTSAPVTFSFDDLKVTSIGAPPNLVWKPYLQQLSASSVTLLWSTWSGSTATVSYGTDTSYSASSSGSVRLLSSLGTQLNRVVLSGLQPNTRYYYKIYTDGQDQVPGEVLSFQTAPSVGSPTPFSFLAFGDYGQNSASQRGLRNQMLQELQSTPYRFILTLGDNAYEEGTYSQFAAQVFPIYRDIFDKVGLFTVIGNHEYMSSNGAPYLDLFDLPTNAWRAADKERYYSFDYGNAHVVVLDSDTPLNATDSAATDDMFDWLRADLSRTHQPWKIVALHHPAYSTGHHGSDTGVQQRLVPIFEANGVQLVLNGHDHIYERSKPLKGGVVTTVDQGGIIYVTSGAGGSASYICGAAVWVDVSYCGQNYGLYSRITVNGNTSLLVEGVDNSGQVKDRYTIALPLKDGFESGTFAQWTGVSGLAIQRQQVYAGVYAARGTSTGTATYAVKQLAAAQSELYYRIRFKLVSATTSGPYLLKFRTAKGDTIAGLYLNGSSILGLSNNVTKVTTNSTTAVSVGTWHELQMRLLINGSAGQSDVWFDGTHIDPISKTDNFGTTLIGQVLLGESATGKTYDIAFDDVATATSFIAPVSASHTTSP